MVLPPVRAWPLVRATVADRRVVEAGVNQRTPAAAPCNHPLNYYQEQHLAKIERTLRHAQATRRGCVKASEKTTAASYEVSIHALAQAQTQTEVDLAIKACAAAFVRERLLATKSI